MLIRIVEDSALLGRDVSRVCDGYVDMISVDSCRTDLLEWQRMLSNVPVQRIFERFE